MLLCVLFGPKWLDRCRTKKRYGLSFFLCFAKKTGRVSSPFLAKKSSSAWCVLLATKKLKEVVPLLLRHHNYHKNHTDIFFFDAPTSRPGTQVTPADLAPMRPTATS